MKILKIIVPRFKKVVDLTLIIRNDDYYSYNPNFIILNNELAINIGYEIYYLKFEYGLIKK